MKIQTAYSDPWIKVEIVEHMSASIVAHMTVNMAADIVVHMNVNMVNLDLYNT